MDDIKLSVNKKSGSEIGKCRWVRISDLHKYDFGVVTYRTLLRAGLIQKEKKKSKKIPDTTGDSMTV